jgi:hypothetical protein
MVDDVALRTTMRQDAVQSLLGRFTRMDSPRARPGDALRDSEPSRAVFVPARTLRDEGMSQLRGASPHHQQV